MTTQVISSPTIKPIASMEALAFNIRSDAKLLKFSRITWITERWLYEHGPLRRMTTADRLRFFATICGSITAGVRDRWNDTESHGHA